MQLWEAGEPYVAEPKVKVTKAVPAAVKVAAASSSKTKKSKPKKIGKGRPRAGSNSSSNNSPPRGGSLGGSGRNGAVGHWGRQMDVYGDHDYTTALDKNDPNYDSTEEMDVYGDKNGFYLRSDSGDYPQEAGAAAAASTGNKEHHSPPRNGYKTIRQTSGSSSLLGSSSSGGGGGGGGGSGARAGEEQHSPPLSLPEYKIVVIQFLNEYFVSGDRLEVESCMRDTWMPDFHFEMVKRTITMAMDRNARGCEAASILLAFLHGRGILTTDEVGKGIERLFEIIDDLMIDVPNAPRVLSQFVARAVVDELLPPVFLTDPTVISLGGVIVSEAVTLLSVKHGQARVEKVWGPGASEFADDLKRVIKLILAEYLDTRDVEEAALSVRLLEAPRYHHELVKRALVMR